MTTPQPMTRQQVADVVEALAGGPVMVNGQPNPTGTGRYCPPAICWCGGCSWWKPAPPPNYRAAVRALAERPKRGRR